MTQITTATSSDLMPIRDVEVGETRFITYGNLSSQILSGAAGVQFLSGTENPPTTTPTNVNVGAQYYNTSTKFYWNWNIGTQSWIPVPKVYRALLTQSGTSAPVATVLENTLGVDVSLSRGSVGTYYIFATGTEGFPYDTTKVQIFLAPVSDYAWSQYANGEGGVEITTQASNNGPQSDNVLNNTAFAFFVYP